MLYSETPLQRALRRARTSVERAKNSGPEVRGQRDSSVVKYIFAFSLNGVKIESLFYHFKNLKRPGLIYCTVQYVEVLCLYVHLNI